MKSSAGTRDPHARLTALFPVLEEGLHERGHVLRMCILAAIASESVFLLGPPGVAKSLVARRLQNAFADARCFDYLMGRFSTPEEIFGPISITRLKNDDVYVRRTEKYLPAADIVFLDEIWKASPPIQNALLTALNEKVFRNGTEEVRLPLKLLIAASNETSDDDASRAFWDRFLVRIQLGPVASDQAFVSLLTDLRDPYQDVVDLNLKIDRAQWQEWQDGVASVSLGTAALAIFMELRQKLAALSAQKTGPYISDRRWKKCAALVRASAWCHNRTTAEPVDCLLLMDCLWNSAEESQLVRALVEQSVSAHTGDGIVHEGAFRSRLAGLLAAHTGTAAVEEKQEQEVPIITDDEYYVLRELPAGALVGSAQPDHDVLEARIWRTDFETLPGQTQAPIAIDIFVYRRGIFQKSVELLCRRGTGWSLIVDNLPFALKTHTGIGVQKQRKKLSDADWKSWDADAERFIADCRIEAETTQSMLVSLREETARHFFAPDNAFDVLSRRPKAWLSTLAELETEITGCRENHGSC